MCPCVFVCLSMCVHVRVCVWVRVHACAFIAVFRIKAQNIGHEMMVLFFRTINVATGDTSCSCKAGILNVYVFELMQFGQCVGQRAKRGQR